MAEESDEDESKYPSGDISDVVRFTEVHSLSGDGDFVKDVHMEIDGPIDEIKSIHSHLIEELDNARDRDGYLDESTLLSQRESSTAGIFYHHSRGDRGLFSQITGK